MYCKNCGAKLSSKDTACPYCGYTSPEKDEAVYMEHLNDLLKETKDLADVPAREYKSEIKQQSRRALKIFLIVAAVFLIPAGLFSLYRLYDSYRSHQEYLEETRFEKKYFPQLNELYQNGSLQESYELMISLSDKRGYGAIFHWKHYPFLSFYGDHLLLQEVQKDLDTGQSLTESDLCVAFYHAMAMTREAPSSRDYRNFSTKEKSDFLIWQTECNDFLQTVFDLSSDEADNLYPSLCDYNALMYSECKKYVHSVFTDVITNTDGGIL